MVGIRIISDHRVAQMVMERIVTLNSFIIIACHWKYVEL